MTPLIMRHILLSGAGVGALFAAALIVRMLAPRDAVLRYRIMVGALIAAGLLLPLQALTAELAPRPDPAQRAGAPCASSPAPGAASGMPECDVPAPAGEPRAPLAPLVVTVADAGAGAGPAFIVPYLAGLAVVIGFHAVRAASARRLLRRARPLTDPRTLGHWDRIIAGVRRPPELLECDGLHAPACRALGRPAVIVPAGAGALEDETLAAALRHELIHLKRLDGAVELAAAALTAALWFQPLTWVFARVLRADREHSCDALVVYQTRRPRSYALALLRFCDPAASPRRAMPLIGFESARSIRRRITMLSHALQPVPRSRRALVFGAALACLVSVSAAHALLTVAAGPGPALSPRSSARIDASPGLAGDEEPQSPRMTAEVRAIADGRSDGQVYERLVRQGLIAPGTMPQRDVPWAFADDKNTRPLSSDTWLTDQETVLSVRDAHADGDILQAHHVQLSLPEGSKLRAVFEGLEVSFEPGTGGRSRILVTGGTVRIVDANGVTRIRARAASDRGDSTLTLTSKVEAGEVNFELVANDGSIPVSVRLDAHTGVPENEGQPPHGAVRWKLLEPRAEPATHELKMQWIYDLSRLRPDGC